MSEKFKQAVAEYAKAEKRLEQVTGGVPIGYIPNPTEEQGQAFLDSANALARVFWEAGGDEQPTPPNPKKTTVRIVLPKRKEQVFRGQCL
ncbi:MAG: hypothetical protein COV91_01345 [Candidatus Taylorbacteria bacterium CG11_big_fil_rev_8_21_14_0_20_46_11]|uniref:Uncharacterized protein n=1 Tax=Candidatus Taylorbacteria bacterium CG11_big_fil_rev_8_21_14_0_20_46_11 TaxID=1975025 RepID=A0A2H0KEC6_9BACT|nr:MAG: hypothetical protein COV91_01345 [Candidatus Taylorbacteria bacterium CG11_big_fil_rev_8_21_14_0_20_46_11]